MAVSLHNIDSPTESRFTLRKVRQIPHLSDSDRARFWQKVQRGAQDDCWLWSGSGVPSWHGFMALGHRPTVQPYYAHRIAWTIAHGEIPAGVAVLHHCDTPRCVNPSHLFLGSQADNMKDASQKGRLNVHRPNHANLKLTAAQVEDIRNLKRAGMEQAYIAAQFSVTPSAVSHIVRGLRRAYTAPQLQPATKTAVAS